MRIIHLSRLDEFALAEYIAHLQIEFSDSREAPFNESRRMFRFDEIIPTILILVIAKRRRRAYLTSVGILRMTTCNNVIADDRGNERD